jgi:hypothetical protein
MVLSDGEKKYRVTFRHYLPYREPGKKKTIGRLLRPNGQRLWAGTGAMMGKVYVAEFKPRPTTECFVFYADQPVHAVVGTATCSTKDVFTKRVGRRVALGRALASLGLSDVAKLKLLADYYRHLR